MSVRSGESPMRALLASVGLLMMVAGCSLLPGAAPGSATSSPTPPDPTPVDPSPVAAPPVILLVSRAAGAAMEALVSGVVGISPKGCVTVAEHVMVAPPGSAVTGNGVHLAGIGDVAFGQTIKASGGFVDVDMIPAGMRPTGVEQCEAVELAVISAP